MKRVVLSSSAGRGPDGVSRQTRYVNAIAQPTLPNRLRCWYRESCWFAEPFGAGYDLITSGIQLLT